MTEIEPHTAKTNKPEKVRRRDIERKEYKESNQEQQNFEDQV